MKKHWFLLIAALLGISVVVILSLVSTRPNASPNGFNRFFPPHLLSERKPIDLVYNSYYFSGLSSSMVYLGNLTHPPQLLAVGQSRRDTHYIDIHHAFNPDRFNKGIKVEVIEPDLFLFENFPPAFISSRLDRVPNRRKEHRILPFDQGAAISANSLVIRSHDPLIKESALKKIGPGIKGASEKDFFLEKQVDGNFCCDGRLIYDPDSGLLVYMYYYRGEMMVLDTNFTTINHYKTIDTVTTAKLKVGYRTSLLDDRKLRKETTLLTPPEMVNRRVCVADNRIFVASALKAENEEALKFTRNDVIDAYSLQSGKYLFSFYIPMYNSKKLTDFRVRGDRLFALIDHYLISWKVQFPEVRQ